MNEHEKYVIVANVLVAQMMKAGPSQPVTVAITEHADGQLEMVFTRHDCLRGAEPSEGEVARAMMNERRRAEGLVNRDAEPTSRDRRIAQAVLARYRLTPRTP